MPGKTSMAVAPAAGAVSPAVAPARLPGTRHHAVPGAPSYELLSKYRGVLMACRSC